MSCAKIVLMQRAARPRPLLVRGFRALTTKGVGYAARRTAEMVGVRERPEPPAQPPVTTGKPASPRFGGSLGLRPGELVEVKAADEIRRTLDERGMCRGLYFMGEMWKFCGRRFTVLKPVERIMVEATGELRTGIKNTVLLEGVCCDGASNGDCDANCYHLWREVWLRRVEGEPATETRATQP